MEESQKEISNLYRLENREFELDKKRIYIGNLGYDTKIQDVRDTFEKFGEITGIQIRLGFAFIVID